MDERKASKEPIQPFLKKGEKMKTIFFITASFSLLFSTSAHADWVSTLGKYDCLEIEKFQVNREDFSNRERERASAIPEETLDQLQHAIVGEATREKIVSQVKKAPGCKGETIVFGGIVTDYKQGSRAARILVGLGAGKQKFQVESYLKDKKTDEPLANKQIIDRKVGGWAGGDEAKGHQDFAEKVTTFIKKGK